ncbi:hypothetical protein ACER0A_002190 [Haloimpatiens sp. FM7315]|uniref:hypothetical protein n=1 Tax=Haloimpatiens sp. FM7315 TaxID=3298609 RepID=UPI0035A2BFAD
MKKYSKGKRVICATKRAFEVIYKAQGFKEVKEKVETENKGDENSTDAQESDDTDEK